MRSAQSSAKDVVWRKIEDNLFTIQSGCLADWNKAMLGGPWLFRNNHALILAEYDGLANPRTVVLDKLAVWNYLNELVIRGMCAGPWGKLLRFRQNYKRAVSGNLCMPV